MTPEQVACSCGSDLHGTQEPNVPQPYWLVFCWSCGRRGQKGKTKAEAVELWNYSSRLTESAVKP